VRTEQQELSDFRSGAHDGGDEARGGGGRFTLRNEARCRRLRYEGNHSGDQVRFRNRDQGDDVGYGCARGNEPEQRATS